MTLDNRSVLATGERPRRTRATSSTTSESGTATALGALLDQRELTLATTDLAVASWGPQAAARAAPTTPTVTAAGKIAPRLVLQLRAQSRDHRQPRSPTPTPRACRTSSPARAPPGRRRTASSRALLPTAPTGASRSSTRATSPSTQPASFSPRPTRTATPSTYTWTSGNVTRITAANGQYITLTYASGKLSGASYATAAGTRSVTYATAAPWRVDLLPRVTGVERNVLYGYDADAAASPRSPRRTGRPPGRARP